MSTTIEMIIAATLAIASGCSIQYTGDRVVGLVSLLRGARGRVDVRRWLPWWLRLPLPLALPLAVRLGPYLPAPARAGVQHALRRAGIDEELSPQQFLAVCVVLGAGAAVPIAVLAPSSLALPLWSLSVALPWIWLRDAARERAAEVLRELPVYIDMLTLALEAGGALSVALRVATERSPDTVLRRAFLRVQGDLRAGRTRAEALMALGERLDVPSMRPLVAALVQADASGGSFVAVLRAQADQRLEERFARAEKLAMEAPVKMLLPLVLCIFPCTFIVLAVPVLGRFLNAS